MADRLLCLSMDGSVRLVSPVDGSVLTTMMPLFVAQDTERRRSVASTAPTPVPPTPRAFNRNRHILDAIHTVPFESIFACYSDGTVLRARTTTNPAEIDRQWKFPEGDSPFSTGQV